MRKNVLALSIATMIGGLGIAGAAFAAVIPGTGAVTNTTMGLTNASALQLAPGGIGHILVVPYFTAQNGNATVLSLVNTDETNGKAIKVRFRGASNSDDILDFTLLMSPGDVWNGVVNAANPNAIAQFSTTDRTCTIPSIAAAGQPFVTNRIDPQLNATDIAKNTREGYIEIFNMADFLLQEPAAAIGIVVEHGVEHIGQPRLDANRNGRAGGSGIGECHPLIGSPCATDDPVILDRKGRAIAIGADARDDAARIDGNIKGKGQAVAVIISNQLEGTVVT